MSTINTDTPRVDVFWSFRSPYCYLALDRVLDLSRTYAVEVQIRPVYPIAVRNPDFFRTVNPKYRRYHLRDSRRMAEYLGVPYRRPVPDPIRQDMETNEIAAEQPYIARLTRLGAAAQEAGRSLQFVDHVARLLWDGSVDGWDEGEHLAQAMDAAGLDGRATEAEVERNPERYEKIIENNQQAHDESDHWGVPTFVFGGETFFGQDRVEVLAWRIRQAGVPLQA